MLNPGASLNVGSRSYINGFDQNNDYSPDSPGFVEESASDPKVLFTSIYDDPATTHPGARPDQRDRRDRRAIDGQAGPGGVGQRRHPERCASPSSTRPPSSTAAAQSTRQDFTIPSQSVLAFITDYTDFNPLPPTTSRRSARHVYITNNNFFHNFDAAMQIEPNGLLAGDPLTPLASGNPFFRGNVMQDNGIDGLMVVTDRAYFYARRTTPTYLGPVSRPSRPRGYSNLTVDSVWDLTDLTYVLQGHAHHRRCVQRRVLRLDKACSTLPVPSHDSVRHHPHAGRLADDPAALARHLARRRRDDPQPGPVGHRQAVQRQHAQRRGAANLATTFGSTGISAVQNAGAGFVVGVDDGVDPPASPLVDPGAYSELRILGIPGNQTTGQQRVPVIITSLRDDTVGTTVRGVVMDDIWNSAPVQAIRRGQARHDVST